MGQFALFLTFWVDFGHFWADFEYFLTMFIVGFGLTDQVPSRLRIICRSGGGVTKKRTKLGKILNMALGNGF